MNAFLKNRYVRMILEILFFLAVFFIIIMPVSFLFIEYGIGHKIHWKWFNENGVLLLIINDLIQLPVIAVLYKLLKKQNLFKAVNFTWSGTTNLVSGIIAGLAAGVFTVGMVYLPLIQKTMPDFQGTVRFLISENIFIFMLSLLINPLYKEVLFRGIIFKRLQENMNTILALFLQSVIYAAVVQGISMPVRFYAFLSALLMGILYIWGRSILIPIIGGVFCNIAYIFLFNPPLNFLVNSSNVYYTTVISLIVLVAVLVFLIAKNHKLVKQADIQSQTVVE